MLNGERISSLPTNAGEYTVTATFGEYIDGANKTYYPATDVEFTINIVQATPLYDIPSDLSAVEGQKLKDVDLPDGWSWQDDSLSVGEEGDNTFTAVYTPSDSNYKTISAELTISVQPNYTLWIIIGTIIGLVVVAGVVVGSIFLLKSKRNKLN